MTKSFCAFKAKYVSIILICLSFVAATSAQVATKDFLKKMDEHFHAAAMQYKVMMKNVPDSLFPKTISATTKLLETSNSEWWCSGFYPGTLLYLFQQTHDSVLYNEALKKLHYLLPEQYNTHTHDLGFMMYCSFGNANKIAPNKYYDSVLINSARSLSTRFNPIVGSIKSWDSKADDFLVIIDNMMNLELLFWATKYTGDSSFYKIAVTHADKTIENHFRADNSSYHVLNYDPLTGKIKAKRTAQGFSDASAWARGQAWGLYGFTVMYRETKQPKYLEQAKKIAGFIINNPTLPADKIPYWDFNAPDIPNALRDASAASIIASALIELSGYAPGKDATSYLEIATTILQSLSSEKYTAAPGTNAGFILKHGVGHKPAGTEIDVPLTYADYYFIEAMARYKEKYK